MRDNGEEPLRMIEINHTVWFRSGLIVVPKNKLFAAGIKINFNQFVINAEAPEQVSKGFYGSLRFINLN